MSQDKLLYIDASAFAHANNVGGMKLLDAYKLAADKDGYKLAITDVVRNEIDRRPSLKPILSEWIEKNNINVHITKEGALYYAYRDAKDAGLPPPDKNYNPKNAGERSIVEDATQAKKAGYDTKIFSDDKYFTNKQLLQGTGLTPDDVRTNAHMMEVALDRNTLSIDEYRAVRDNYDNLKSIKQNIDLKAPLLPHEALDARAQNLRNSHIMIKGAAGVGIAISAWEWYHDGEKVIQLYSVGNDTAALSELKSVVTEAAFTTASAGLGATLASMGMGAYAGAEAGALSPTPPHPFIKAGVILAGGLVGGLSGAFLAGEMNAERIQNEINIQQDHDGHQWQRDDKGEWSRIEMIDGEKVTHHAVGEVKQLLDYQATTISFELGIANLPTPKDPYAIPNESSIYTNYGDWIKNLETDEWSRSAKDLFLLAKPAEIEIATPEQASELDRQSQNIIYENAINSPATMALRYTSIYEQQGWETVGEVPQLFTKINDLDIMAASDGNVYKLDNNHQWISEGFIWDSKPSPKIEHELNATREALDNVIQANQQFLSQDISKDTERSQESESKTETMDMSTWSSGDKQFDDLYAAAISDDPNALRKVCQEISDSEFGQKFQAEIDQLYQLEQQQMAQLHQQQLLEQEQREQAQRAKQNEGISIGR